MSKTIVALRSSSRSEFVDSLFKLPEISDHQLKTLLNNYRRAGCFFKSYDLHTMLDCGPDDEEDDPLGYQAAALPNYDSNFSAQLRFGGRLRQEFFGGIYFDIENHKMYKLDRLGFSVLSLFCFGLTYFEVILVHANNGIHSEEVTRVANQLFAAGILYPDDSLNIQSSVNLEYFPAYDFSLNYMQSPYIVEIEGTHGCYRKCAHCAYDASPDIDRASELSTRDWCNIIDKLSSAGVLALRFTGGDFLFRDDAVEILNHADRSGMSYHLLSDTVAFNSKAIDEVAKLQNLAYIGSSLDGNCSSDHDFLRGEGAFELLVSRVQVLARANLTVRLGTTLHKRNFQKVRETGALATKLGATHFNIGFLAPIGRGVNLASLVLDGSEVRRSLLLYLDGVKAGDYAPQQMHYLYRSQDEANPFADLDPFIDNLPFMTEWPYSRMRIKPSGVTYTAGRLKSTRLAFGTNILRESLRAVWNNSPNLVYLRKVAGGCRQHSLDFRHLAQEYCNG